MKRSNISAIEKGVCIYIYMKKRIIQVGMCTIYCVICFCDETRETDACRVEYEIVHIYLFNCRISIIRMKILNVYISTLPQLFAYLFVSYNVVIYYYKFVNYIKIQFDHGMIVIPHDLSSNPTTPTTKTPRRRF